jgi:hypothetical protein
MATSPLGSRPQLCNVRADLLARGRQDWKELSKAEKMEYAKKYKAEHGEGETDGEEMEQQNGDNPSAGPGDLQSPAHAGPGSLVAEARSAPEYEAARDMEGLAVQEKRVCSRKFATACSALLVGLACWRHLVRFPCVKLDLITVCLVPSCCVCCSCLPS